MSYYYWFNREELLKKDYDKYHKKVVKKLLCIIKKIKK